MPHEPTPRPDPPRFDATRDELRRISTHVLARGRWAVSGRFGLRVVPGGIATPAFGEDAEVLRLTPYALVREHRVDGAARSETTMLRDRSLEDLARLAGVDLDADLSVGEDSPLVGDRSSAVEVDPDAAREVFGWFDLGARALDLLAATSSEPSIIQLWPEHFDVAVDLAVGSTRVNLGASPGDGFHDRPYLYVGPWGAERPGDPGYWNAPFGAVLDSDALAASPDRLEAAVSFFRRGVELLG